jgi:hypothetical protein
MPASSPSPRTLLVWGALLGSLLVTPLARAQRDDRSLTSDRPRVRGLIGGGITLPLSLPLASYGVGGGFSLGLEWPQSDYHSLLVRFDYDHLEQRMEFITLAPGEEKGSANLALLRGGVRFQQEDAERPLRSYVEASIGAGFRSLSEAGTSTATQSSSRHVERAVAPAFTLAAGTAYRPPGGGLGFYIESALVFLLQASDSGYVPIRVGVMFP